MRPTLKLTALAAGLALIAIPTHAQFNYSDNDLILNFRQTDGAASDPNLTVNLGNIFTFKGLTGTTTLTQFDPSQLTTLFGDFDNLAFSVLATEKSAPATAPYVNNTLWLTTPRLDINLQTTPPNRGSSLSQGGTASKIASIGDGANTSGTDLSATATTLPDNAPNSYHTFVGSGTFNGSTAFNVENNTGAGFTGTGLVRSDLYELIPGSGAGTYLGYFEFSGSGSMDFVAAVPEPSSFGLLISAGVLGLAFRRKLGARVG